MTPSQFVQSADVKLAVYTWGKPSKNKPTVVLVHGYPDAANVWKASAELLAKRYFVVAYDVRGAGNSTRPTQKSAYDLKYLVDDLAAVVEAVSPKKAVHLVAHDWGSIQSWEAVTTPTLQGRIASYTTISGPSLDHAGHWIRQRLSSGSPKQLAQLARQAAHSWYIAMFHLPLVAPTIWRLAGDKFWPTVLEKAEGIKDAAINPTQASDGKIGVNLYRANILNRVLRPQQRHATIPVQLIVPTGDNFMVQEIWDDLAQWTSKLWRREVNSGHWIQVSHPQLVADYAAEFIDFIESGQQTPALQLARVA